MPASDAELAAAKEDFRKKHNFWWKVKDDYDQAVAGFGGGLGGGSLLAAEVVTIKDNFRKRHGEAYLINKEFADSIDTIAVT